MNNQTNLESALIILVVALGLVAAVAVVYLLYQKWQRRDETARRHRSVVAERYRKAIWASAVVVTSTSMAAGGLANEKVRVDLKLDVVPPEGERYPVRTAWWVDPEYLQRLRPGETVLIKIDRMDGMRIYPNEDWAEPLEWGEDKRQV